jgi:xylulokinase
MEANKKFLGIDIGTTSLKAAVFNQRGERIAKRTVDYVLDTDSKTGFIEFDATKYIDMCKNVIEDLSIECGKIDALSIDTQGETLILTDEEGTPLCPAIVRRLILHSCISIFS